MFETLREFLGALRDADSRRWFDSRDPDLAAVALFFHVIGADGKISSEEIQLLKEVVAADYSESEEETRALLSAAESAEKESIDLFAFTSVLNRRLDEGEKIRFVELLWEFVYADGVRHELEEHVVWRIADLLGVSGRDRVLARQRAAARSGGRSEQS
jgi:Uncharacterized protein conserved in bacteria